MKDSQILSAFQELPAEPVAAPARVLVFDACQVGVVLRAILFVQCVMAVAVMYSSVSLLDWVERFSLLAAASLPATLIWLVAACSLKQWLADKPAVVLYALGALLGAFSGWYGCWSLAFMGFVESPPWWASACSGLLLALVLVAALFWRAKARAPAQAAARLSDLQARIRPHFLFNTLNSAIALVRAEPAKAEAMLEDLSDLFRHALAEPGDSVTVAEELTLAQRYLAIEQVRFGSRLRQHWELDPEASLARLPPLLLQPLVENAVRHGVEPSPDGADLRVVTERRGDKVVIKVINTVPAGPGQPGLGLALTNVRDRLNLLHDVQGSLRTILKDGVYQVRVEIPA